MDYLEQRRIKQEQVEAGGHGDFEPPAKRGKMEKTGTAMEGSTKTSTSKVKGQTAKEEGSTRVKQEPVEDSEGPSDQAGGEPADQNQVDGGVAVVRVKEEPKDP